MEIKILLRLIKKYIICNYDVEKVDERRE